jgi:hypothetical protein
MLYITVNYNNNFIFGFDNNQIINYDIDKIYITNNNIVKIIMKNAFRYIFIDDEKNDKIEIKNNEILKTENGFFKYNFDNNKKSIILYNPNTGKNFEEKIFCIMVHEIIIDNTLHIIVRDSVGVYYYKINIINNNHHSLTKKNIFSLNGNNFMFRYEDKINTMYLVMDKYIRVLNYKNNNEQDICLDMSININEINSEKYNVEILSNYIFLHNNDMLTIKILINNNYKDIKYQSTRYTFNNVLIALYHNKIIYIHKVNSSDFLNLDVIKCDNYIKNIYFDSNNNIVINYYEGKYSYI